MTGGAMTPVPADDPRMIAWKAYQETDEYKNTRKWALDASAPGKPTVFATSEFLSVFPMSTPGDRRQRYVEASLWAAFIEGFAAGREYNKNQTAGRIADRALGGLLLGGLPGQGDES